MVSRARSHQSLSHPLCMAGTTGLEPATSAVTGQRSNQLSYVPRVNLDCRRAKTSQRASPNSALPGRDGTRAGSTRQVT